MMTVPDLISLRFNNNLGNNIVYIYIHYVRKTIETKKCIPKSVFGTVCFVC